MASEWVDITEELAFDCAQLKLGQLVHEPGFSLHEAMTAIEIMHPQVNEEFFYAFLFFDKHDIQDNCHVLLKYICINDVHTVCI